MTDNLNCTHTAVLIAVKVLLTSYSVTHTFFDRTDLMTLHWPTSHCYLVCCLNCLIICGVFNQQENTYLWRTSLYLAASASAEFFADIALAPMEAVKVRIQTMPGFANTLRQAVPKMYAEEGLWA